MWQQRSIGGPYVLHLSWGRSHVSSTGCTALLLVLVDGMGEAPVPGLSAPHPLRLACSLGRHARLLSLLYYRTYSNNVPTRSSRQGAHRLAVLLRKAYSPAALGRSPHMRAASPYIYVCYSSRCMGSMEGSLLGVRNLGKPQALCE